MKLCTLTLLFVAFPTSFVFAQSRPLREATSENGRFQLRITPGRPGGERGEPCQGVLLEKSSAQSRGVVRWERTLVNDVAPEHVFVRDDGRFVVTLDEFRRGGAAHAVVVYGARGELLRHFLITDLLEKTDWHAVKTRKRSIEWLTGAQFEFIDDPAAFVIHLPKERVIRLDLRTLQLQRGADAAAGEAQAEIPAEVLRLLALQGGAEAGEESPQMDLAVDPQMPVEVDGTEEVMPGTEAETLVEAGAEGALEGEPEVIVEAEALEAELIAPDGLEAPFDPETEDFAGLPQPPMPNPARPTDYVTWASQYTQTVGPNAGPEYQAAIDALVKLDLDEELLRAAENGDPAALQSEEIAAYLDANRAAIAYFRNATDYEFNGWPLHSEDGSMIGALLPNLAPIRQLSKMTVMEGRRLETEGLFGPAADHYVDALAAGVHAGQGITLIENLVGISVQSIASQAMLDMAANDTTSSADYTSIAERLENVGPSMRPMQETMQMERAMMLDTLQRLYKPDPSSGGYVLDEAYARELFEISGGDPHAQAEADRTVAAFRQTSFEDSLQSTNEVYDAMTAAIGQPYRQARAALETLEARVSSQGINPLVKSLLPSFTRVHFLEARGESQRRAAALVSNLMAYRQTTGTLPDSLDVFGGRDFAVDPFTDGYFQYRREGDSFTLYSLGNNGTDEGGIHDARGEANDLLFWPRPPKE